VWLFHTVGSSHSPGAWLGVWVLSKFSGSCGLAEFLTLTHMSCPCFNALLPEDESQSPLSLNCHGKVERSSSLRASFQVHGCPQHEEADWPHLQLRGDRYPRKLGKPCELKPEPLCAVLPEALRRPVQVQRKERPSSPEVGRCFILLRGLSY
jgi:hypothetical protein